MSVGVRQFVGFSISSIRDISKNQNLLLNKTILKTTLTKMYSITFVFKFKKFILNIRLIVSFGTFI